MMPINNINIPQIKYHSSNIGEDTNVRRFPQPEIIIPQKSMHVAYSSPEEAATQENISNEQRSLACTGKPEKHEFVNARAASRRRCLWSEAECNALSSGIQKYGKGAWTKIIEEYREIFDRKRRVIDLVNKYRLLSKSTSFYRTPKRNWVYISEDGTPAQNQHGSIICYNDRFPFTVATKVAKLLILDDDYTKDVEIRELEDVTNAHRYRIQRHAPGVFKVKKLVRRSSNTIV